MKVSILTMRLFLAGMVLSVGMSNLNAQEEPAASVDVGADLVSNYIWRGTKFGTGPAVQPFLEFSAGNFTAGSWGSFGITDNESPEADIYLSYGFDFGLSLGVTDYYFPGSPYFDVSDSTGSHGFELNLGYELGGFSLSGNYMLNEAGGAGTAGGDIYVELGYGFSNVGFFVGAGNGWHTSDGEFSICNIGISASKELSVSDTWTLPISGTVILNPETEQYYVVFGISF